MEKILTLIIPTYNMEKYLDYCLTSLIVDDKELIGQFEVLVVIDGATDRSSEIAHTYQERFPDTFIVIDKENGNYGSCINCGLKKATGKYVKVLDADDSFNTINFEKYLRKLSEIDVDLVITDFVYKNEQNVDYQRKVRTLPIAKVLHFNEVVDNFNSDLMTMHEITYKRAIFSSIRYHQTEGISYTDLEWCFLPMTQVYTVYYWNEIVYRYLIGREGQTVSPLVAMKSISHKIKSAKVMLAQYAGLTDLDKYHSLYLKERLSWSVNAIYYNYLISSGLSNKELEEFDVYIRDCNHELYKTLNESLVNTRIKFKYISNWRVSKYSPSFKLRVISKFLWLYSRIRKK